MIKKSSFLIHPCSPDQDEIVKKLYNLSSQTAFFPLGLPPQIGGRVYNEKGKEVCLLPIVPLNVEQFFKNRKFSLKKIKEAVKFSIENGAKIIGLGALTSPFSRHGQDLLDSLPEDVFITTGNPYTVWAAYKGIEKIIQEKLKKSLKESKIGVIGATGSVGNGLVEILKEEGVNSLFGIGRDEKRIEEIKKKGIKAGNFTDLKVEIKGCDIVVFCTSGFPQITIFDLEDVKIIYDLTMPRYTDSIKDDLSKKGIEIVYGGWIRLPEGWKYEGVPIGLPENNIVYACLADTLLRGLKGEEKHILGIVNSQQAKEIGRLGEDHGFQIIS